MSSKITVRKLYSDGKRTLEFVKVKRVPGFSHRVVIDGIAVNWLANTHKPGVVAARFYFEEHPHGRTIREASSKNS